MTSTAERPLTGSCTCRAVRFVVSGPARDVIDCHCDRCRRFTGHHMAATSAHPDSVVISDAGGALKWYSPAPRVHYGFCSACGSSLFWRSDDQPESLSICAGTLDVPTGLRTTKAWWVAHASDYFSRDPTIEEFEHEG
jgi:hypothetical protein